MTTTTNRRHRCRHCGRTITVAHGGYLRKHVTDLRGEGTICKGSFSYPPYRPQVRAYFQTLYAAPVAPNPIANPESQIFIATVYVGLQANGDNGWIVPELQAEEELCGETLYKNWGVPQSGETFRERYFIVGRKTVGGLTAALEEAQAAIRAQLQRLADREAVARGREADVFNILREGLETWRYLNL